MNQDHVNLSLLRAHSSRVPTKATPTCEFSKTLSSSRGRLYGESKMNPVRLASAFILVLVGGMWMNVTVEGRTVFLERGQRGIIPCPTVQSQELSRGSLDGAYVYWYFSNTEPLSLLISLFRGRVEPQNEIPEGVYDIDGNFSLVIENVTDSNAGTFFCRIKPREEALHTSNISVAVKVHPREPFPQIIDCDGSISGKSAECEVYIPYDVTSSSLTCEVRNAKPAVDIQWFRLFSENKQRVGATQSVTPIIFPPDSQEAGWFQINNTYTTSATIPVYARDGDARYQCEAYGSALGDKSGSHMIANIVIQSPPSPRPVSAGTTTSWDQEVVASTTEVPYELPVVGIALGSSFGGLIGLVIVVWLLLFVVQNRRNSGRLGRDSEGGTPLLDYLTVEGCQNILKPLFQAKMQNISIDPSEENQGDAMSTEEIFIDLELHEKNHSVAIESREQMIGLLGGQKRRRHFVVKGAAGCGKTTLVRRFGYDWANGADYMQKFELVFVLKMKEMIDESGLLSAILRQNFPSDQTVSKKALGSVIRKVGYKVLIILDGLDEINLKVLNQRAPPGDIPVRDILAVKSLASCCIIVTTRPHMMKKLNSWNEDPVFAVIETTGFSQQNRNKYIKHRFSKDNAKAAGLIRQIETAAFLEILAKIPIMLRLLCYIWDNSRQDEVLPARITELYRRVTDALLRHWERKYNTSRESKGEGWEEKVFGALGKVAFAGLMDSSGERLVFPHGEFPGTSLNDGLELGFFLERPGSNEATATFIHKTFQEYFAAYFLVRQTESFIQQELLSKVTIDTVQEVEYVLRFACGMNTQVASVIFQHVRSIKDELISDRYLWVQHLTLMLYYESQSDILEAGVGSRLSLKYKEEFAALQYYVDKIPLPVDMESLGEEYACRLPKVHLERLEVYLHVIKDQSQVKSILQRVDVDYLYFGLLVSDTLGEELNQLSITISDLIHKPARTIVCINKKEQGGSDGAAAEPQDQGTRAVEVLVPFCKTKIYGFGLRIECDIIQSQDVLFDIASSLAESRAVYFGVLNNRLNGYMKSLLPLIPFLEYLELYDCDLREEDLMSLAAMMPRAERLCELYISGGSFSTHAVRVVAHSLTHCSRILMLELRRTGMTPKSVERGVKEIFPEMKLVQGNIDCQFWLRGHPSG